MGKPQKSPLRNEEKMAKLTEKERMGFEEKLTEEDKSILKAGNFFEQSSLLIDHFNDKDDKWIREARRYFRICHKKILNKPKVNSRMEVSSLSPQA